MGSIFSTYSTGENRVTASILAVLRSLSLDRIQRILGAMLESSEFELVHFQNQPAKGGKSVPDAIVQSSVRILIETKIKPNSIKISQIKHHLTQLDDATEADPVLLVLTPDEVRPSALDSLDDNRIAWSSFAGLDQAIDEVLDDKNEVVSEREAFLLRQLQEMLAAEDLLASPYDVLVVAAKRAWPEYRRYQAYICQPNRHFQHVTHMAFYSNGMIHPHVPRILATISEIAIDVSSSDKRFGPLVKKLVEDNAREEGTFNKVMLLSAMDDESTIKLRNPVTNNLKSEAGKNIAFTQGHRYVTLDALRAANSTSELVD